MNRRTFMKGAMAADLAPMLDRIAFAEEARGADNEKVAADRQSADRAWRRTEPDFPIYLPSGDHDSTNQMVNCVQTPKGTWVVTFTMSSKEAKSDQRVVATRSADRGKSWSKPVVIDGRADGKALPASWVIPFVVPGTGRVYAFYNKNTGQVQVRKDITGELHLKYSDDDGASWIDGGSLPLRMGEFGHPSPKADPNWIGLYSPLVTREGQVLFPFARYKAGPDLHRQKRWPYENWQTEAALVRFDNILTEPDVSKLKVTILPEGPRGVRVPHRKRESFANEPSAIQLNDGRLFMVMRTRINAIWYAVSADLGKTWSDSRPLLDVTGEVMLNPNAPVFIARLEDGRIVMIYFNAKGGSRFGPRDPAYITVGVEALDREPPVTFAKPRLLMTVNGKIPDGATSHPQIAAYGSFFRTGDELYLIYPDCKYFILGKRITDAMLPPAPQVPARTGAAKDVDVRRP